MIMSFLSFEPDCLSDIERAKAAGVYQWFTKEKTDPTIGTAARFVSLQNNARLSG